MGYKGLEIYTIRSSIEEKEEDEEEEEEYNVNHQYIKFLYILKKSN
jgi:hypothetical protein